MLRTAAARLRPATRNVAPQRRTIVDNLNTAKNDLRGKQAHYQQNPHLHGADDPTYLKGGADKAVNVVAAALFSMGVLGAFRGMGNMSFGVGQLD